MADSRILIIGANGQLGKALAEHYPMATALDKNSLDITDWDAIANYDWSKVDVILNAAAYTKVDSAETPEGRELAWKINSTAVGYLSKIACHYGITLVHISSDYVFDGSKAPYNEDSPLTPLGVYGQTKAAGDIAIHTVPNHYILRTSWLIGDGPNFVRTMIGVAEKNISPSVVDDQIGRLTFTDTLVRAISHLLDNDIKFGVYNLTNDGEPASWSGITRFIFQELKRNDLTVTNIPTSKYVEGKPGSAPRPANSTLDLAKINAVGFTPTDWREELANYIKGEKK